MTDSARDHRVSPAARAVADSYLAAVSCALSGADADLASDTLEGLSEYLADTLDESSSADDAKRIVAHLGTPEEVAASLGPTAPSPGEPSSVSELASSRAGTLLGVPYDVRVPTAERVASRWWNTHDRRVFVPRVFGLGWDLNFGAIAVHTGIVRPDDEDEPFGEVAQPWFVVMLAVPAGVCIWMVMSYARLRDVLPAQLPTHWNLAGEPDGWWSQTAAFGMLLALAVVPTLWACVSVFGGRRPLNKGATIAFAALMTTVAGGLWVLTLVTVLRSFQEWWAAIAIVAAAFAVPFLMLVTLARLGRRAEMRRDLGRARKG